MSRASVPALPQSIDAGLQAAQADAVHDELVAVARRPRRRARAPRRASTRCRPSVRSRARRSRRPRPRRAAARGARSTCRRARRGGPRAGRAGSISHRCTARDDDAVALRLEQRRGALRPRPRRRRARVSVPPRSGEMWWSSKSSMLIRSAPSACVIPASTPGRSGTCTRSRCSAPGSGYSRSSMRRRLLDASPIQRARKPASPCSSAASTCSIRRRCSASALADRVGVVEEDVDPDARVRARDARHVAERAAGVRERLVPVDARRARLVDDHVREHVRHVARQRDEPVVRVGVDRDRRRAEVGRRSRARAGGARGRCAAIGVRNHVAPSKRSGARVLGAARLGAADRVAADEARRAVGGRARPTPSSSRRR